MPDHDDANPFARPATRDQTSTVSAPQITNPYVPTSQVGPTATVIGDDVESMRRYYLSHEAAVKSIGILYMLGAIFMVPIGLFIMLAPVMPGEEAIGIKIAMRAIGFLYFSLGLLQGFTAVGLRKLRPWARIVATVFSVLGLLAFPLGTLISAYILYLLLSEKGKMVFSPGYEQVMAQTPHIKYKTSIIVWIFLGLLVALVTFAIVVAVVGG
ncbi:putative membrane protein [Rhodopirellula maiorica SM1]|uniref:Putative membrane protein n=1 Tax=Rhodopirellula maiorica SM1 TaxID=1265738 RepID=M5REQ7_9BACT|nr:putative membrane protein [Rhodopirellula maiorica]EMI17845.1 putative membrane protein [Rhodopirellula maiorica SM1]